MSNRILDSAPQYVNGEMLPKSDPAPNPFDLKALRLSQDFGATLGVKKVLTVIRVTKPHKSWFVQTHPNAEYRCDAVVLELGDEGEMYWVSPPLWQALADEPTVTRRRLIAAITTQQNVFVWPIGLPDVDGKLNGWHESALAAAEHTVGKWCRIISNRQVGAYQIAEAGGVLKEPQWPELSFQAMLELAFKDRCITSWDHPVLKRLRGES